MTERLARTSALHPWRTIAAWIAAIVVGVVAVAALLGNGLTTEGEVTNNADSIQANRLIDERFPRQDFATELIVIRSERLTYDDPAFRARLAKLSEASLATKSIAQAQTPLDDPSLVSRDRHAVLIRIELVGPEEDHVEPLIDLVRAEDGKDGFDIAMTGQFTFDHDFNEVSQHDLESGELGFGLPAALIVLVLVFGALVAAGLPLLLAIVSILVALGLTAAVSSAFELSIFVVNMLTGMGLALGIDYALFVVSRFREERAAGKEKLDAIAASGATASRAVLFSGSAFVLAMLGLLLVQSTIMRSLAAGAILVGIVSVIAALTLLPALLSLLGDGVNRLHIPFFGRGIVERSGSESRFWGAIVRRVVRRPVSSFVVAALLLLAAATPVIGMKIGTAGVGTLPDRVESKQGLLALERSFPAAGADPAEIVVDGDVASPAVKSGIERLEATLAQDRDFGKPTVDTSGDNTALIRVPVASDALSDRAIDAVERLRSEYVPAAFEGVPARVLVTGTTAENIDYFDVMNAAYGLVVAVFQHGIGSGVLGFQRVDTIEAWVPLFLFAVLFGLSMDYQVFLLSRIREHYSKTRDTGEAVTFGIGSTARIITGAALIIVAVFSGFAAGDLVMFQQMGFGVAVALLIDATIVRSVLVPAAMQILGERNWYLPGWLQWLPHIEVEGHEPTPEAAPAGVARFSNPGD